jgi:hypothetical protein
MPQLFFALKSSLLFFLLVILGVSCQQQSVKGVAAPMPSALWMATLFFHLTLLALWFFNIK